MPAETEHRRFPIARRRPWPEPGTNLRPSLRNSNRAACDIERTRANVHVSKFSPSIGSGLVSPIDRSESNSDHHAAQVKIKVQGSQN